jgi:hypothetical protein
VPLHVSSAVSRIHANCTDRQWTAKSIYKHIEDLMASLSVAVCSPRQTRDAYNNSHAAFEDEPALDALIAQVRQLPAGLATTATAEPASQLRASLNSSQHAAASMEQLLPLQQRAQLHLAALQAGAKAATLQSLPSDSQQLSIGGASAAHVFGGRLTEVRGFESSASKGCLQLPE